MFNFRKNIIAIILFIGFFIALISCTKKDNPNNNPVLPFDTSGLNLPPIHGKLVYHTYSCYSCNDSRLYLFDFDTKQLIFLSKNWNITNPMNAHIALNGKKIVFMGIGSGNWDVFTYRFGSVAQPNNLTSNSTARDEDPKFSPDGSKIVFKRNGILKEMDTTGLVLRTISVPQSEASMPYYTNKGNGLLYAGSETGSSTLDIFLVSLSDGITAALSSLPNVEEYYPIARDDTSFLFTRWNDQYNQNDQVYLGFYENRPSIRLPFNQTNSNFSDAFPINEQLVILSSTKSGGYGQYDLYLADIKSGKMWSLSLYNSNINTSMSELGACYSNK